MISITYHIDHIFNSALSVESDVSKKNLMKGPNNSIQSSEMAHSCNNHSVVMFLVFCKACATSGCFETLRVALIPASTLCYLK